VRKRILLEVQNTSEPVIRHFPQFYAWMSWMAVACFLIYQVCAQNALAPIQDQFQIELQLKDSDVAIISSVFFISYALMQIPAGVLIDRFGVGWVVPPACLLLGLGTCLLSLSNSMEFAIASRVLMGFAGSFSFLAVAAVARRRINKKQLNIATGLIDFAFGFGAILGAAGIGWLATDLSWRPILAGVAIAAVPIAILNWFVLGRGESVSPAGPGQKASFGDGIGATLGNRVIWELGFIYMSFVGISFGIGGLWNEPLQEQFGRTHEAAAMLTTIMFIALSIGALLSGLIADRVGHHYVILIGGLILSLVALYRIIYISQPAPFWVAGTDFALLGSGLSVGILIFPMAFREVSDAHAATAVGLVNGVGLLGAGIFQFMPGIIRDQVAAEGLLALQEGLLIYVIWPGVSMILLLHLLIRNRHRLSKS
jgi:MFS family permease